MSHGREAFRQALLATVGYALATVIVTWPAVAHWGSAVAGWEGLDSLQYTWSLWWSGQAWDAGHSAALVDLMYYPWGGDHALLAITPLVDAIAYPLEQVLTPTAVYNTLFLTSFPLTGLSMYLLSADVGLAGLPAFLAGLIWAFFPHRMGHALAGHLTQMTSWLFPLTALAMLRLFREPGWRWALVTGLLLAASCYVALVQTAYMVAPLTALLLIGGAMGYRRALKRPLVLWVLGALALAALLVGIGYGAFMLEAAREGTDLSAEGVAEHSTDLLAWVLPSPYHPLWGRALRNLPAMSRMMPEANELEHCAYLGWTVLALAGLGLVRRSRWTALWAAMAVVGLVLALGPQAMVGGEATTIRLPYGTLMRLPFYGWGRTPERLNQLAMLGLALLAAQGLAALRLSRVGTLALCAIVMVDLLVIWPFPSGTQEPPELVMSWRGQEGAVLDVPIKKRQIGNLAMYYQTAHGLPIVGGYIHRELPGMREYVKAIDALVTDQASGALRPASSEELAAVLAGLDIRHVLLHRQFVEPEWVEAQSSRLSAALGPPAAVDERALAFDVPPQVLSGGQMAEFGGVMVLDAVTVDALGVAPGDTVTVGLWWQCLARPDADYTAYVHLVSDEGVQVAQHDGQPLGGNWPTSWWAPGTWCLDEHEITLPAGAEAGAYRLLVGWYDLENGQALAVDAPGAATVGQGILLDTRLTVQEGDS